MWYDFFPVYVQICFTVCRTQWIHLLNVTSEFVSFFRCPDVTGFLGRARRSQDGLIISRLTGRRGTWNLFPFPEGNMSSMVRKHSKGTIELMFPEDMGGHGSPGGTWLMFPLSWPIRSEDFAPEYKESCTCRRWRAGPPFWVHPPGLTLSCDGRGRSALTLSQRTCCSGDWLVGGGQISEVKSRRGPYLLF